jgi:ABC-type multidrug transport system ATPase subunit
MIRTVGDQRTIGAGVATVRDVAGLRNASARLGGRMVLSNVSIAVASGEMIALRGANGSGKTTLLRMLAGVLRPAGGRVSSAGSVAFLPSGVTPPVLSAKQWLTGLRPHRSGWSEALGMLGFDGDLSKPCRVLSLGNFRKVLLADALTSGARLVLLDEATVGLDDQGRAGLVSLVAACIAANAAVVQSEQDAEPIPLATRIWRVHDYDVREMKADGIVTVSFTGPRTNLDGLRRAAEQAGFHEPEKRHP